MTLTRTHIMNTIQPFDMAIDFERQQFFWSRVRREGDHMIWEGANVPRGYGKIQIGKDIVYAHRVSYCIANGLNLSDIEDKTILITCGRLDCVAPAHLAVRHTRHHRS